MITYINYLLMKTGIILYNKITYKVGLNATFVKQLITFLEGMEQDIFESCNFH